MLVLSRKPGEKIVIGANIVVSVVEVRGNRVKLAFQAPIETPVLREEIFQRQQFSIAPPDSESRFESPFIAECA